MMMSSCCSGGYSRAMSIHTHVRPRAGSRWRIAPRPVWASLHWHCAMRVRVAGRRVVMSILVLVVIVLSVRTGCRVVCVPPWRDCRHGTVPVVRVTLWACVLALTRPPGQR